MPSHSASAHPTRTDRVWRVMRFETTGGKYAEVASNEVGPEAIKLPPGYKFVRSTPMVPRDDAAAERVARKLADEYMGGWESLNAATRAEVIPAARELLEEAGRVR